MDVPRHIAIIMDGNGRWARKRNLPRIMGHREGVKTASAMVKACAKRGIKALTLYAFSLENRKRPKNEVDSLMSLLKENLKKESRKIHENNLKFNVIGRVEELPALLRDEIERVRRLTAGNAGMALTLAINYGGRQEIFDAACDLFLHVQERKIDMNSLGERDLEKFLYTRDLPELDLIVRTSGEMRLSNFLLWQAAYAEFYVTDILWPDFTSDDLGKALEEYAGRGRRFGG